MKYNGKNKNNARQLRKNMTLPERTLWYHYLRDISTKFYRQRPVDNYILDFYCPKLKLAIELDGGQHYQDKGMESDKVRTEVLSKYEIRIIRFSNNDVLYRFESVCEYLDNIIAKLSGGAGSC